MKRILIVFGTRPEAIKLAPVVNTLRERATEFEVVVCVTAQHREMLDQVLEFFEITPEFDLDLMKSDQTLNQLSARILTGLNEVLESVGPDLVCVQGDTTTAMIGALAAFHMGISVAHVEAGLRSGRKDSPFPEEINRILVGQIADFHFAPTAQAEENLRGEGITENVWTTGNTSIDALHLGLRKLKENPERLSEDLGFLEKNRKQVLVTAHRRESFGEPFERIVAAIRSLAEEYPEIQVVFPVHLNPRVRDLVYKNLEAIDNIYLIPPVDYPTLIWLLQESYLVLTDSGGIQEEAPTLGKPVLVMRDVTERIEGVEAGTAKLVGSDSDKILSEARLLLDDKDEYAKMALAINPFGDGRTSEAIANIFSAHPTLN
jgi:UDP-N-acetylglucosamine 2-epimerase (non-hydrolysing)